MFETSDEINTGIKSDRWPIMVYFVMKQENVVKHYIRDISYCQWQGLLEQEIELVVNKLWPAVSNAIFKALKTSSAIGFKHQVMGHFGW